MAAYTFPPAVVLVEGTGEPAPSGTLGVLRATEGGAPAAVYDLNNSLLPNVEVGQYGVHQAFKADIPDGVLDFGSVLLPTQSLEAMRAGLNAEAIASAAQATANTAATSAATAATAASSAQSTVQGLVAGQTFVRFWQPGETVAANVVRMSPTGQTLLRITAGTTRSAFDTTELAAWTVVSSGGGTGGAGTPLTVAATTAADGTLAGGKLTPVDATSGARTMTLPTGRPDGTQVAVRKIDSTENTVTLTGSIAGAASSVVLASTGEGLLLVADPTGSWWPVSDRRTNAAIDARVTDGVLRVAELFAPNPVEVYKSVNQQVISSVTLVDDNDLQASVAADSSYRARAIIYYEAGTAGDLKVGLALPVGATAKWRVSGLGTAETSSSGITTHAMLTEANVARLGGAGAGTGLVAVIEAEVTTGAVPGQFVLRWAQNTADATPTIIYKDSYVSVSPRQVSPPESDPDPDSGSGSDPGSALPLPYTQAFTGLSAWPSEWTIAGAGTATVTSDKGVLTTAATASTAETAFLADMPAVADVDITVEYTTPSSITSNYAGIAARVASQSAIFNQASGYWVQIRTASPGGYIGLYRAAPEEGVGIPNDGVGSAAVTADVLFDWAASTTYKIRFQVVGTTLRAKVWLATGSEPGSWTISGTDSTYTSGRVALMVHTTGNSVRTATFDNLTVTADIPPVSGSGVTLPYSEPFTGLSAWPSSWTTTGTAAVTSDKGVLTTAAVISADASAYLANMPSTADVDVTVDYTTPGTNADHYVAVGARAAAAPTDYVPNTGYWVELRPYATNGYVGLYRATGGGASTNLVPDLPFTWANGTAYKIRFQAVGTTIRAKVWLASGSEPSSWMLTATDASFSSGRVFASLTTATATARTATFDNFAVAAATPDTPPTSGLITPTRYSNGAVITMNGGYSYGIECPNTDHSFAAVVAPNYFYARSELRAGEKEVGGLQRERCEMRHRTTQPFNTDVWFAGWVRVTGAVNDAYHLFNQFHQAPESNDVGRSPTLGFTIINGNFEIYTRGDTAAASTTNPPSTTRYSTPYNFSGVWQHFVGRARFSKTTASGQLQVWRNSTQIINVSNILMGFNDTNGPTMKIGLYRGVDTNTQVVEHAHRVIGTTSLLNLVTSPGTPPAYPVPVIA